MKKTLIYTKKDNWDKLTIIVNKKSLIINATIDQTGNTWTIAKEDLK